ELSHCPAADPGGHYGLVGDLVDGGEANPERSGRVLSRAFRTALNPPEAVKVAEGVSTLCPRTVFRREFLPVAVAEDTVIADEESVVAGIEDDLGRALRVVGVLNQLVG